VNEAHRQSHAIVSRIQRALDLSGRRSAAGIAFSAKQASAPWSLSASSQTAPANLSRIRCYPEPILGCSHAPVSSREPNLGVPHLHFSSRELILSRKQRPISSREPNLDAPHLHFSSRELILSRKQRPISSREPNLDAPHLHFSSRELILSRKRHLTSSHAPNFSYFGSRNPQTSAQRLPPRRTLSPSLRQRSVAPLSRRRREDPGAERLVLARSCKPPRPPPTRSSPLIARNEERVPEGPAGAETGVRRAVPPAPRARAPTQAQAIAPLLRGAKPRRHLLTERRRAERRALDRVDERLPQRARLERV